MRTVFEQSGKERLVLEVAVVLSQQILISLVQLERSKLVAALLKALDDLANQPALDACRTRLRGIVRAAAFSPSQPRGADGERGYLRYCADALQQFSWLLAFSPAATPNARKWCRFDDRGSSRRNAHHPARGKARRMREHTRSGGGGFERTAADRRAQTQYATTVS